MNECCSFVSDLGVLLGGLGGRGASPQDQVTLAPITNPTTWPAAAHLIALRLSSLMTQEEGWDYVYSFFQQIFLKSTTV